MTLESAGTDTVLSSLFDAVLDVVVVSFAFWTLLYCLGLTTQWSLWPSGWVWLVATLVAAVLLMRGALRAPTRPRGHAAVSRGWGSRLSIGTDGGLGGRLVQVRPVLLLIGLGLVAASGVGVLLTWASEPAFRPTWAALVLGLAVLTVWALLAGRFDRPEPGQLPAALQPQEVGPPARRRRLASLSDLGVIVAALAVAALTSLVRLASPDDVYYLNRSVWVAEHGNAALRDTMFSPEVFNSTYGGGVPIASVEALYGVLAHLTGTLAGTMTYIVAAPVLAFLGVLAMWRLSRRWAPRRPFLVLLGSLVFLLLSGDAMLGNFWIVRIWQGKVIAVAVLMPLIWAYLTELAESAVHRERLRLVGLLFATGIAFFGLTPTAVMWGPVMLGAGLAAAVAVRSCWLAIGSVAMAVGPLVSGATVALFSSEVGGKDPGALTAQISFVRVLGESRPMVALALVALGVAVVVTRRGAAAALAGAAALASLLVFAPGILPLLNALTGSGPILWRMLFVAPIPVLVGLLLAVPLPARSSDAVGDDPAGSDARSPRPVLVNGLAVVCVLLVVPGLVFGGRPIWQHAYNRGEPTLESGSRWKVDLGALYDVRALVSAGVSGTVLLPPRRMKVLAMYSTDAYPVVPRKSYIRNLEEPEEDRDARFLLFDLAEGRGPLPSPVEVSMALERLDVGLACAGESPSRDQVMELYADAGYSDTVWYGWLSCARPSGGVELND